MLVGEIAFAGAYFVVALLLFNRFAIDRQRNRLKDAFVLCGFVLLGIAVFAVEGLSLHMILQLVLGILIFNGMLISYGSRISLVYIALGVLFVLASLGLGYRLIAQAMLIGAMDEVAMMRGLRGERNGSKMLEARRDVLQLSAGAFFILLFYLVRADISGMVLILTILLGVILINYARLYRRNGLSRLIYSLERKKTTLGNGALWLAMGSLVAASFLNPPSMIIIFAAMFIGDSLATIIGMAVRSPRLPYNRSKSIGGTFAYFLSTSLIAFPVVGPVSFLVGLVAAVIESIPWGLDDNFAVSFIITAAILVGKAL